MPRLRALGPVCTLLLSACGPAVDPATVDPKVLGPRVFRNCCLQCHGAAGAGYSNLFPPLAGSPIVQGDADHVVRIVLHGMEGPLEVDGRAFNSQMPSWIKLHDAEIAAVVTFIRAQWGNAAGPVTMADVARIRARYKDRTRAWTMEQLKHEK